MAQIPGPLIDRLERLMFERTQGQWFTRIESDTFGNADFYIDTNDEDARHWPFIGYRGFCHVEGKAYECLAADAELMALAPMLAQMILDLDAR